MFFVYFSMPFAWLERFPHNSFVISKRNDNDRGRERREKCKKYACSCDCILNPQCPLMQIALQRDSLVYGYEKEIDGCRHKCDFVADLHHKILRLIIKIRNLIDFFRKDIKETVFYLCKWHIKHDLSIFRFEKFMTFLTFCLDRYHNKSKIFI